MLHGILLRKKVPTILNLAVTVLYVLTNEREFLKIQNVYLFMSFDMINQDKEILYNCNDMKAG